jgi:Cu2+-exporting ATPase
VAPQVVLQLAAAAEQGLDHPAARAIASHAAFHSIPIQSCTTWNYVAGQGVVAEIDGQVVHVGSRSWMAEAGVAAILVEGAALGSDCELASFVYVARDGELLGIVECVDSLRPESGGVLASLRAMNKGTWLVSGDRGAAVQTAAASLGIDPQHVYAELLPHQKAELVQALRAGGRKVAVVGDGINDAGAMAHADVAVALGSATDLARETADIVLLNDGLRDLVTAMEIARHTMQIVEQNKWIVVAPNVAAIAYGIVTVMNPIAGVVINNGTALVAGLNSMRALRGPRKQASSNGQVG